MFKHELPFALSLVFFSACDIREECYEGYVRRCDGKTARHCVAEDFCLGSLCGTDWYIEEVECEGVCLDVEGPFCALDAEPDDFCDADQWHQSICIGDRRAACQHGYLSRFDETCEAFCVEYTNVYDEAKTVCSLDDKPAPECEDARTRAVCRGNALHWCTGGYVEEIGEPCEGACVTHNDVSFCALEDSPNPICGSGDGEFCGGQDRIICSAGYVWAKLQSCEHACVETSFGGTECVLDTTRSPLCTDVPNGTVVCDGTKRIRCVDGFMTEVTETCDAACADFRYSERLIESTCVRSEEEDPRCRNRASYCDERGNVVECFAGHAKQGSDICSDISDIWKCVEEKYTARCVTKG